VYSYQENITLIFIGSISVVKHETWGRWDWVRTAINRLGSLTGMVLIRSRLYCEMSFFDLGCCNGSSSYSCRRLSCQGASVRERGKEKTEKT